MLFSSRLFVLHAMPYGDILASLRFALEPSHRAKRQSSYTYYSINERHLMPDYNQFKRGRCQVNVLFQLDAIKAGRKYGPEKQSTKETNKHTTTTKTT